MIVSYYATPPHPFLYYDELQYVDLFVFSEMMADDWANRPHWFGRYVESRSDVNTVHNIMILSREEGRRKSRDPKLLKYENLLVYDLLSSIYGILWYLDHDLLSCI